METPQGLLIRLTANFPSDTHSAHSDFKDAALNSVLDILKTTDAELMYACQMDSSEQMEVAGTDNAVFIVRLSVRKSRISTKSPLEEKQKLLDLFVHNFTQRSKHNLIREVVSVGNSDVNDFEVEWTLLKKHG